MTAAPFKVCILGAGISGLTVAYRLQQLRPNIDIIILDPLHRPGGTIWTERRDGFQLEIGPNGFLDTKPTTVQLCRDLGLGDRLVAASEAAGKNRYLLVDGRLKPLPGGLRAFVKSDLLSWRGKLSFMMERFRAPRTDPTDESVDAFATRRAGREVADVFADALVTGIHAGDPKLLSIRAAFPRIAAMERDFGSVIKGLSRTAKQRRREAKQRGQTYERPGKMWSFRDGLRQLVETLSSRLKKQPLFGVAVRRITQSDSPEGRWLVLASANESWTADALVLACPAHQQAELLANVDAQLAEKIAGIVYNRVVVVGLGFRRQDVPMSLDGFGYISPQRTRRDLLGVQWCSSIFPARAPEGAVLLRAMCGGWHRAEMADWDDDRLLRAVRAELQLAMSIQAEPIFHQIVRWNRAIPQYQLGHLERVASIEQQTRRHPGLFLTGNAYHGVAMNDCTEQGTAIALQVAGYLSGQTRATSLFPSA